jgi:hypothetical protein
LKLFLDCEFSQLNKDARLVSLALVAESGQEFYVELLDTYDSSTYSHSSIHRFTVKPWWKLKHP